MFALEHKVVEILLALQQYCHVKITVYRNYYRAIDVRLVVFTVKALSNIPAKPRTFLLTA